jgi:hypothetical protein
MTEPEDSSEPKVRQYLFERRIEGAFVRAFSCSATDIHAEWYELLLSWADSSDMKLPVDMTCRITVIANDGARLQTYYGCLLNGYPSISERESWSLAHFLAALAPSFQQKDPEQPRRRDIAQLEARIAAVKAVEATWLP